MCRQVGRAYSTPNRLIIAFDGINPNIVKKSEEVRGPSVNAPEKALDGFIKSNQIKKNNIYKKNTEKGEFYFYKKLGLQIFFWLFFIAGFWLWAIGRSNFHIGASGVVYALASFIFFSGLIKKQTKLSAASLLVIFLYGSMIWGVLPIYDGVSWEGHLAGLLAGLLLAIFYRNEGPKPKEYQWEIDEELERERQESKDLNIHYFYKEED